MSLKYRKFCRKTLSLLVDYTRFAAMPKSSLVAISDKPLRRMSGKHSQTAAVQHSSPNAFPEKEGKVKSSRQNDVQVSNGDQEKAKTHEHKIDIGDEKSDLLGYEVLSGKLALDKRPTKTDIENGAAAQDAVDAELTTKALFWGSHVLSLADVISVSYSSGLRHFTVHAYPLRKKSCGLSCFLKPQRSQKDFRFLASNLEEARQWVTSFVDLQCYVNLLPHPMVSSKKQGSDEVVNDPFFEYHIKSKSPPKVLIILNPRSGHGRSSKVFHGKVEPIFKVLNGLLGRHDQKEAISIPIGIIPAGSDNSLVWTVLGVRDPVSAAMTIVKGGLTPTDIFAVEWIQTGVIHFGSTVSYFGFLSDDFAFRAMSTIHLCLIKSSVDFKPLSTDSTPLSGTPINLVVSLTCVSMKFSIVKISITTTPSVRLPLSTVAISSP
ncbi:hypothetical protein Taro_032889 [Colocasia esculenta]|uniref:DAGKc domain-containing protein n=1 Tax=Colocasia esculenta TaxID=4460 RepID=A0A843W7G0_COLES|nr:hypothetical protein [Colocasia esculenta]